MSCNSFFLNLVFCIFLMLHSFVYGDLISYNCGGGNIASNTAFNNLVSVNQDLYITTPFTGFTIVTDGTGQEGEHMYGLALCRGDISLQDCGICVLLASIESSAICQNQTSAILWYDHCLFKYTNKNFFGQIDSTNKFKICNVAVAGNAASFNQKTSNFLTVLAQNATINTPTYLATGVSGPVDGSTKQFGLVQCTWDLSSDDCFTCLEQVISEIPNYCYGLLGARFSCGSCYVRYETYNFLGS